MPGLRYKGIRKELAINSVKTKKSIPDYCGNWWVFSIKILKYTFKHEYLLASFYFILKKDVLEFYKKRVLNSLKIIVV